MTAYDFEYYKPTSPEEAVSLFQGLDQQGKEPVYFSGGTEIITLGRVNRIRTGAVIDIKGIPEVLVLEKGAGSVIFGAAQTLNRVRESQYLRFLSKAIAEIADHTARNKITLGGNLCATIVYRETALPLLLTDSQVVIVGPRGRSQHPLRDLFDQSLRLQRGELLLQVITHEKENEHPFLCIKKRKQWDVGYPLLTVAALKKNDTVRFAFSGLCAYPFFSEPMEERLNDQALSTTARVDEALQHLPATVLNDVHGSADYRRFVLRNTLLEVLTTLGGKEDA